MAIDIHSSINQKELLVWILKNQGNGFFEGFPHYTIAEIVYNFRQALPESDMLVESDHEGILGVVVFRVFDSNKILYINQIKTHTTETFITLMEKLVNDYPDYTFVGKREEKYGGNIVYANPKKLLEQAKRILQIEG